MKRLSGRFAARRLIAVAGAGALLSAGLGVAGASAASRAVGAAGTPATSVPMVPCAIKYAAGNLYVGSGYAVDKVSQQTGTATGIAPKFGYAQACGVAVDGAGNVLVADGADVVAVAAKTGTFYGKKMVKGDVYPIASGFQGITGAVDVQLDPSGNVVIAVGGEPASHTDNEQDSQIFVLAERAGTFYGKRMARGKLYVIAGVLNGGSSPSPCDGPDAAAPAAAAPAATKAAQANLGYNIGTLRFDAEGNIILADSGGDSGSPCGALFYDVHPRVAVIPARTGSYYGQKMTVGDIYSIAGLGTKTGNGVPAVDSDLPAVSAVAIDHAGNVLVAIGDTEYVHAVRVIAAKAGTFYGQKMIKGDIYSLPGLDGANAVAVDSAGNVLAGNLNDDLVQMLAVKTGAYFGVKARAGRVYTIAGTGRPPAF
jgi:hypothetical protein